MIRCARHLSLVALFVVLVGSTLAHAAPVFDPEAATQAYLDTVSGEARERSDAYFEGGYWIQLWDFLIGAGVGLVLLQRRISARMRDVAARMSKRANLQVGLYWVQYLGLTTVLTFPWSYYTGFAREHAYELSNHTMGSWLVDQAKGLGLGAIFGGIMVMIVFAVIRRAPKRWWLWGYAVTMVFVIFGGTFAPVFVAPMFNEYTPLEEGPVRQAVLSMARANGVSAQEVWMSDASRQSTRISANVSGMMGTERITLNDNLLERCSSEEVEAVMGHELGHYILNHAYEGIMFFGVVLFAGFAVVGAGGSRLLARFGERWDVKGVSDPAALPALMLVFQAYFFLLTPVLNSYIRANESEADAFGLNVARQPEGFAEVSLKLGEYRKLDPGPIEEMLFFDHPSGRTRIQMAMTWKAEHLDEAAPEAD